MWLDGVTRWRLHMLKPSRADFYRRLFRRGRVLDVGCANGGGANQEQVKKAFQMILHSSKVKGIFVNIFGGIMRCTIIATAIVEAYKQVGFNVPLVVRLEGTEVEQGRKILAESGVDIIAAKDLTDAANKVVAAVK
jgi:succinyl-CoA synthetase beta subunit